MCLYFHTHMYYFKTCFPSKISSHKQPKKKEKKKEFEARVRCTFRYKITLSDITSRHILYILLNKKVSFGKFDKEIIKKAEFFTRINRYIHLIVDFMQKYIYY